MKQRIYIIVAGLHLMTACAVRQQKAAPPAPAQSFAPASRGSDARPDDDESQEASERAFADFRLRRSPDGVLPLERYREAQKHKASMRAYSAAAGKLLDAYMGTAQLPNWTLLGPTNISGRTRAILIDPGDPNTIYAGAVTGGVWKTTNAGTSWTSTTDSFPLAFISTMAMDPTNSQTIYAGTGEFVTGYQGLGILKTTDGGNTWTLLPATANSNFYFVNKIQVSKANPQHIYAATRKGVLFSPDGGNTWNVSLAQLAIIDVCTDLQLRNDQSTDTVFAACTSNADTNAAGIWRNQDAAGSGAWTKVYSASNVQRISLSIAPSSQSTIYALTNTGGTPSGTYSNALGAVLRSTSNGDSGTWTTQTSNQSPVLLNTLLLSYPERSCNAKDNFAGQASYDMYITVDPVNPNRVWVLGTEVFRSDDGGVNWGTAGFAFGTGLNYIHTDNHVLVFSTGYNGTTNQTVYVGNDGGIFRSDNAAGAVVTGNQALCGPYASGITWSFLGNTYATTQFYFGDVFPGASAFIGGTQDNGIVENVASQGPSQWFYVAGGDGGQTVVDPLSPSTFFIEAFGASTASIQRTQDGGHSFSRLNLPSDPGFKNAVSDVIALDPGNTSRVYTGGLQLYRSTDSGTTWTAASAPIVTPITPGLTTMAANGITAVAISPTDSNRALFGTVTGEIYRSSSATTTTGATAWPYVAPRFGLVSSIVFDPTDSNVAYATYTTVDRIPTDNHVYKSTDGGATWSGIDGSGSTGLPDLPLGNLVIDPAAPTDLYVGSDMGVFVSLDAGATWARDVSSISDTIINRLVLDRGSGVANLTAFTFGRGVWQVTLPNSGTPCTYSVSPGSQISGPGGGLQAISVNTQSGCVWSATTQYSAVQLVPPAGGIGPGKLYYQFVPNTTAAGSSQTIFIQGIAVQVSETAATPVTGNDEVITAAALGTLPATAVGATSNWTSNTSDPVHSCTGSRDTSTGWFRFTASSSGTVNLSLYSRQTSGSDAGAVVTAYSSNGSTLGPELACGKTNAGAVPSVLQVSFNATSGTVYLIELSTNSSGPGGTAVLNVAMAPPPASIAVAPGASTIPSGGTQPFTATSINTLSPAVRWSVTPPDAGTISAAGVFSATNLTSAPITATITATSISNPAVSGNTTITIAAAVTGFQLNGVGNSASYRGPGVSPGEIIVIFGNRLGPAQLTGGTVTADGFVATSAGGAQVLFDGRPAPMLFTEFGVVSTVVPYEVADQPSTQVQISYGGQISSTVTVPVVASAPGLFTASSLGSGQLAIVNQDGPYNSAQFGAVAGTFVTMFATGEGQTNPPGVTGQVNNSPTLPVPAQKVTLTIGGQPAQLLYAGAAPGGVAGAMQIDAIVPASVTPGPAVPVQLTVGSNTSPNGTTMSVLGDDGRRGIVAYTNTGSTPMQVSLYTTQASPAPAYTGTIVVTGPDAAEQLGQPVKYGNTAGIQIGNGPVRVLSQVCSYNNGFWLCKGSATQPFPN